MGQAELSQGHAQDARGDRCQRDKAGNGCKDRLWRDHRMRDDPRCAASDEDGGNVLWPKD